MFLKKILIPRQQGVSVLGLVFVLVTFGGAGILAMRIVPTYIEFTAAQKAIINAKSVGTSVKEIRESFDRSAAVQYIASISGSDLVIVKADDTYDVSFAYEKRIHLAGPMSLALDYEATTPKSKSTRLTRE